MSAQRFFGISALLLTAASCASHNKPNANAVAPERGPKASIYANYTGGLLNRLADATFKVDESAYVMVAHLGGDGRIEVLYPQDGRETGYVPRGKWFRTPSFSAYYDAVPQMYSFTTTRFRGMAARLDSYDGLGNGFVFIVASRSPLRFDRISTVGLFDEYDVEQYRTSMDPRTGVKNFVEQITGGRAYTLKYARSYGTTAMTSYVDQLLDCAYFGSLGLSALDFAGIGFPWMYSYGLNTGYFGMGNPTGYLNGCGNRYRYASAVLNPFASSPRAPGPALPTAGVPRFDRPGFGPRGKDGPTLGFNRPTHRGPATGTANIPFAPRDFGWRPDRFGQRIGRTSPHDFGGGGSAESRGSSGERTYHAPRTTPGEGSRSTSAPRETVQRSQPAETPRVQPQSNAHVEKSAPSERKP